ncbi:hypothetical protein LINPERHAP2_LOCUS7555 [Linum perenne]
MFGGPWMGILKRIGDRISTTVRMDHTTLEGARGNFARICVEVDLSKPLLSKYRLRRRVRRIEYEGLHTICFGCGCYGHEESSCTVAKGEEELHAATTTTTRKYRFSHGFLVTIFETVTHWSRFSETVTNQSRFHKNRH